MTTTVFLKKLQSYQRAGRHSILRKRYLKSFLPKMLYRTTKSENPETTQTMVDKVLRHGWRQ